MTELTLSTVGLTVLNSRKGEIPCLLMMPSSRGKPFIYCIEMNSASSLFLSPLYEHTITLVASKSSLSTESEKFISDLKKPTLYTVGTWNNWSCRVEENHTYATLTKKLATLLNHTLFIQSSGNTTKSNLFSLFCSAKSVATTTTYPFIDMATLKKKYLPVATKSKSITAFWNDIIALDKQTINHAINSLFAYEKKSALYPKIDTISVLFSKWRSYASLISSMNHRILEMEYIFRLCQAMHEPKEPLLFRNRSFTLFHCNTASNVVINDYIELVFSLWSIMNNKENTHPVTASRFHNYAHIIDLLLPNDGLRELIHFISTNKVKNKDISSNTLFLKNFLLPLLFNNLEKHSLLNTLTSRSTVEPIRLRTVVGALNHLFRSIPKDISLFDYTLEDNQTNEPLTNFNRATAIHIIDALIRSVEDDSYRQYGLKHKWIRRDHQRHQNDNSILFYIEVHSTLLTIERDIMSLTAKHMIYTKRYYSTEKDLILSGESTLFDVEEDIGEEQQQWAFLLFTPNDLASNMDIEFMKYFALNNYFTTSILRESSTNHFFASRVSSQFLSEMECTQWYNEMYFESDHFYKIESNALKETMIIPDAHLLTTEDMHHLLKRLIRHKSVVRKVLFIGSLDIMPFIQNGQPLVDLLYSIDNAFVNRHIFNYDALSESFSNLIHDRWILYDYPSSSSSSSFDMEKERNRLESAYFTKAALFHLENSSVIEPFVNAFYDTSTVNLLHICTTKHGLTFNIGKRSVLRITDIKLDHLLNYKRSILENRKEIFVIDYNILYQATKNELHLLFYALDSLIVVGRGDELNKNKNTPISDQIIDIYNSRKRPNLRYTALSIMYNK